MPHEGPSLEFRRDGLRTLHDALKDFRLDTPEDEPVSLDDLAALLWHAALATDSELAALEGTAGT